MSVRLARRIWLAALLLLVPLPLFVFGHELAPAARYALMLGATLALAAREGAAGPVPGLALLLAAHLGVYAAAAWAASRGLGRMLAPLPPRVRAGITLGLCGVALAVALAYPVYRTPLGPRPVANLVGALS